MNGHRSLRRFVPWGVLCIAFACSWPSVPTAGAQIARYRPFPEPDAAVRSGLRRPAAPAYDVVALRVEFQPDTTRFTTGEGTFDGVLYGGLEPAVDPLPHDAAYFQAHLAFLEDYVARVSDGKTVVRTHLVPDVVQLPDRMGAYAPTGPDADGDAKRGRLARLVYDAWTQADAESDFDMSGFVPGRTALVIFHAGVGRDVELIGTTLDKTPEDLPSIFFGNETLRRLGVEEAVFNGFPIDHSMIVPRTETRLGMNFITDEPFLLELSINGMLAASFFNFLGVPDLFDVESGESAIGPFGLMDAQGIFAYGGLFPPEPMAWTKYYLGWTEPVDLDGSVPATLELHAASVPETSESARAVISDVEYFLVENRYRDPEQDGLTLRVRHNDTLTEQHVENGDETFNSLVVDGFIGGVVVGVDNYDWALPGGVDEEGNELNGGMLIWHVDERRLRAGLAQNAVNVGDERAIDLEEADGAQDIGFPSGGPFGPQADLGSPFDFFYEGNPVVVETAAGREVRLYENRFGPDTHPASRTNASGPSFIVLEDFSAPGAAMSFTYRRASVFGIEPMDETALEGLRSALSDLPLGSKLSASDDYLLLYDGDSVAVARPGEIDAVGIAESAAAPALLPGDRLASIERTDGGFRLVIRDLQGDFDAPLDAVDLPDEVARMMPVSPIVYANLERAEAFHVLFRSDDESVHVRAAASGAGVVPEDEPIALAAREDPILGIVPVVFRAAGAAIDGTSWSYEAAGAAVGQPVVAGVSEGILAALPLVDRGEVILLLPDGGTRRVDVRAAALRSGADVGEMMSPYPVLADLDGDGRLDLLIGFGTHVFAFTQSGAVAAGFPIELPSRAAAQPLVFRFEGDEKWTVLSAASDGYLYAHDADGRLVRGFPVEVGDAVPVTPVIRDNRLVAASSSGSVKGWMLRPVKSVWWGSLYASGINGSYVAHAASDAEPPPIEGLIDETETYNWPNPVQDGVTHLRVRTARDARVEITIIDAGGGRVEELDMGAVTGGVPAEVVWQADVQSGLYFARYVATTTDGERAAALVKMAVIR